MTILETFRLIAAEFKDMSDEIAEQWFSIAKPLVSHKRFGSLYAQAVALLSAHKMKLAGLGENSLGDVAICASGVSSYTEGSTSVSFSTNQQTNTQADAEYGLTNYGTQFLTLRRTCIVTILSSAGGDSVWQ